MRYNLRHLRVFLSVTESGSVTKAAEQCNVSQPAVTQAIAKLEQLLGHELFNRTPRGLFVSAAGRRLATRVQRAFDYLDPALEEFSNRMKVTSTAAQLEALLAVREMENFTLAAKRLKIAQPTVHRAISQLEKEAGKTLFERSAHGTVATRQTQNLAQAVRLAFAELAQADADLGELNKVDAGQIVIGSMPLSRSALLPAALSRFREVKPTIPVRLVEGDYNELLSGLRRGEIDFLIGALRNPLPIDDVVQECILYDQAMIVAGLNHPLAKKRDISLDDLSSYPWVVASVGTPIRLQFDKLFSDASHKPISIIESSSLILMRELLDVSNHLGFISTGQASAEIKRKLMTPLAFDLGMNKRPIGLTFRKNWLPTASQALILDYLNSKQFAQQTDEASAINND